MYLLAKMLCSSMKKLKSINKFIVTVANKDFRRGFFPPKKVLVNLFIHLCSCFSFMQIQCKKGQSRACSRVLKHSNGFKLGSCIDFGS